MVNGTLPLPNFQYYVTQVLNHSFLQKRAIACGCWHESDSIHFSYMEPWRAHPAEYLRTSSIFFKIPLKSLESH